MITTAEIKEMILAGLPGSEVNVSDMTGTSDHFQIDVVAREFAGKTLIEQHKILFAILACEMDGRIHAVKLKTRPPQI